MTMQRWEYKTVTRWRDIVGMDNSQLRSSLAWEDPKDIDSLLAKLGDEGWELVALTTYNSLGSVLIHGDGPIVAGVGTHQTWVFKRPKQ